MGNSAHSKSLKIALAVLISFTCRPAIGSERYRVAIIDLFYPAGQLFDSDEDNSLNKQLYGQLDLDDDDEPEPLYHGDLIHLLARNPELNFIHYPILHPASALKDIHSRLIKLRDQQHYMPVDALVLSWESSTLISNFPQPLSEAHTDSYKQTLMGWAEEQPQWQTTLDIIRLLETLESQGVDVYTIAGNGGKGMINTFSFADGVTTVGAIEPEMRNFIADNALVDTYERSAYPINRITNEQGKTIGFDIDGDGCIEIGIKSLSSYQHKNLEQLPTEHWQQLRGSSFAAPIAMKRALLEELGDCASKQQNHHRP